MASTGAAIASNAIKAITRPRRYRKGDEWAQQTKSNFVPPLNYELTSSTIQNIPVEKLKYTGLQKAARKYVILQLHGGGFKVPLTDLYRWLALKWSSALGGATVYSVNYRTYPPHRHPAALEDVFTVWQEMSSNIPPDRIIIAGDSSGGSIALALCLKLRDMGLALPGKIVLFSPWADLSLSDEACQKDCCDMPMYGIPHNENFEDKLSFLRRRNDDTVDENNLKDPYFSPAFGEYTGLPPLLLQCGTADMTERDTDIVYERAAAAGCTVTLTKYQDMFHNFQLLPFLKESKNAWKEVRNFVFFNNQ